MWKTKKTRRMFKSVEGIGNDTKNKREFVT